MVYQMFPLCQYHTVQHLNFIRQATQTCKIFYFSCLCKLTETNKENNIKTNINWSVHLCITTSDLWGVDGEGVVGVWQQIHVEAKRHVANRWDLILRRTPSVQEPRGGKLQLLQSVETQTLHERTFNLREGGRRGRLLQRGIILTNKENEEWRMQRKYAE